MLTSREQILIKHLVESYICDGKPVGSEKLLYKTSLGCSPATIRNELITLEKRGFLESTHISSGRIPTVKGYRLFIDNHLKRKPLTKKEKDSIKSIIFRNKELGDLHVHAPEVLSNFTDLAAIATPINNVNKIFKHIEFHILSRYKILAILITDDDVVENKIFAVKEEFSYEKLEIFKKHINENFSGKPLENIPTLLKESMISIKNEIGDLLTFITEFTQAEGDECVINGQSNLASNIDLLQVDKIKKLVELFEKKQILSYLLTQCINSSEIKIFIGHESGEKLLTDCSLVAAPYIKENKIIGVMGVIGPKRMNYQRIMEIVDFTAKIMSQS